MRASAERVQQEEKRRNGLVIVQALYGQMQNDRPGSEHYPLIGDKVVDVTIPLQAFVHDSQLRIYTGKVKIKSTAMGVSKGRARNFPILNYDQNLF